MYLGHITENCFCVRRDPISKVVYIIGMVELTDLFPRRRLTMENSHLPGKLIVLDETMGHFDSFGFHGVIFTEDVFGDLFVVDVGNWVH